LLLRLLVRLDMVAFNSELWFDESCSSLFYEVLCRGKQEREP
jgi:hypothetical protein